MDTFPPPSIFAWHWCKKTDLFAFEEENASTIPKEILETWPERGDSVGKLKYAQSVRKSIANKKKKVVVEPDFFLAFLIDDSWFFLLFIFSGGFYRHVENWSGFGSEMFKINSRERFWNPSFWACATCYETGRAFISDV